MIRKVIGILDSTSPASRGEELSAFHRGLQESGIKGSDAMILYAWADNDEDQLRQLADELKAMDDVNVIVAAGGPISALVAKKTGTTKPIIFTTIANPRHSGLVQTLHRPGENLTGTFGYTTECEPDRISALDELLTHNGRPGKIGILINSKRPYPERPDPPSQTAKLQAAAANVGRGPATIVKGTSGGEIDTALVELENKFESEDIVALLVTADPLLSSYHEKIIGRVAQIGIPTIYQWPDHVKAGGLMSYGPSKSDGYRHAAACVGHILKNNRNPADLKVNETQDFKPYVNSEAARRLRIRVPPKVLGKDVITI